MRNEKLRDVFESLGFKDVQTVVSSGNVVFEAEPHDVSATEDRLEQAWPRRLGFRSTTIIRTREQIDHLFATDPFGDVPATLETSLQVTALKRDAPVDLQLPYISAGGEYTIVALEDRFICSVVDLRVSGTPNLMRSLEQMLGKQLTTRTWMTMQRIRHRLAHVVE
jgi:uncharacterized protein (DUF1697 family)